jgi:hypothetical protein
MNFDSAKIYMTILVAIVPINSIYHPLQVHHRRRGPGRRQEVKNAWLQQLQTSRSGRRRDIAWKNQQEAHL